MRIYAMKRNNWLFIGATKNFVKSANISGKSFCLGGGKAFFEKLEEPFAGRKNYRACIKTLSLKPEQHFPNADSLLHLTYCFSRLKAHFHRFPILPVPAIPLCLGCSAAAIPQISFKRSVPPVSGFTGSGCSALSWMKSCCHSSHRFFIRKYKRSKMQFFKNR